MACSGNTIFVMELIEKLLNGSIDTVSFCDQFEQFFNIDLEKHELSLHEKAVFTKLFDTIIWYSPYEKERQEIQNYVDEEAVFRAAKRAADQLESGKTPSANEP